MQIKKKLAFTINANLKFKDGTTEYFPFTVLSDSDTKAESILKTYLKTNIGKNRIKYIDVVEFKTISCFHILE